MKKLMLCLFLAAAPVSVSAADLEIRVVSRDGAPLASTVLALRQPGLEGTAAGEAVMDQRDRQFSPYVMAVPVGTLVRFPNSDDIRHHVYSFSPAKTFELKLYAGSTADPVIFDQPGLVTLGCNIHDWMLGFIYVTDAPHYAVTDAEGRAIFTGLAPGEVSVEAWQPRLVDTSGPRRLEMEVPGKESITLDVGPELRREPGDDDRRRRRRP